MTSESIQSRGSHSSMNLQEFRNIANNKRTGRSGDEKVGLSYNLFKNNSVELRTKTVFPSLRKAIQQFRAVRGLRNAVTDHVNKLAGDLPKAEKEAKIKDIMGDLVADKPGLLGRHRSQMRTPLTLDELDAVLRRVDAFSKGVEDARREEDASKFGLKKQDSLKIDNSMANDPAFEEELSTKDSFFTDDPINNDETETENKKIDTKPKEEPQVFTLQGQLAVKEPKQDAKSVSPAPFTESVEKGKEKDYFNENFSKLDSKISKMTKDGIFRTTSSKLRQHTMNLSEEQGKKTSLSDKIHGLSSSFQRETSLEQAVEETFFIPNRLTTLKMGIVSNNWDNPNSSMKLHEDSQSHIDDVLQEKAKIEDLLKEIAKNKEEVNNHKSYDNDTKERSLMLLNSLEREYTELNEAVAGMVNFVKENCEPA